MNAVKERNIRKSFELISPADRDKAMEAVLAHYYNMFLAENPTEEDRKEIDTVFAKFRAGIPKVVSELEEDLVEIYDHHLSNAEIEDLLDFYGSPNGRNILKQVPEIQTKSFLAGQRLGGELMKRVIDSLEKSGIDIPEGI
jgi:hypothetical protein